MVFDSADDDFESSEPLLVVFLLDSLPIGLVVVQPVSQVERRSQGVLLIGLFALAVSIGAVVFLIGGVLQTAAQNKEMMMAGRFFAGIGVGMLVSPKQSTWFDIFGSLRRNIARLCLRLFTSQRLRTHRAEEVY